MKITIEQAKQQITEGFSSIMTREDVLHLLDCIETLQTESSFNLTDTQINNLSADIANEIVDCGMDLIEDYDLSMSYREVELDGVNINHNRVQDTIITVIDDFIKSMNKK